MKNKINILNDIKNKCSEEQFDLIMIASIIELSHCINKENIYLEKLNSLKNEDYEKKFPKLYEYLFELSNALGVIEKTDSDNILKETLDLFFDTYHYENINNN